MSIPKLIHYCWFGGNPLPKELKKYIDSWKEYLPDYQIIEWNESNFDVHCNAFVEEAYEQKKYAFVSDYARLFALYQHGGIYLDVDIQVVKRPKDVWMEQDALFCFESEEKVMTAFMAVKKESPLIGKFLEYYKEKTFDIEHMAPNTELLTALLKEYGAAINGKFQKLEKITVFPNEYFNAFDLTNSIYCITEHTYMIHHFYGSWCSKKERLRFEVQKKIRSIFGQKFYDILKKAKKKVIG